MSNPIIIHTINLIHVSRGRNTIINKQVITPRIGINGTRGVLKALGASGCFTRSTHTPIQTNIKARGFQYWSSLPQLLQEQTLQKG